MYVYICLCYCDIIFIITIHNIIISVMIIIVVSITIIKETREMFYLTTHSTHFIYGYMASDIWLRTILIVRKETRCRHIGYSYRLTARVLLYAPSHRQDSTYHGLCYTSRGALAETRNSSMDPPHEGSIRRPIAPRANALPLSYVPLSIKETATHQCISCYYNVVAIVVVLFLTTLFHGPVTMVCMRET